jgi:Flp pilus assembly pilin Flp
MHRIRNQPRCGRGEDGQTTVEYAVILAALAIAAIVALGYMSGTIRGAFRGATPSPDTAPRDTQMFQPPLVTCDAHYSGACIPPPPPDLDCDDLAHMGITGTVSVSEADPHHLDTDGDGIACN